VIQAQGQQSDLQQITSCSHYMKSDHADAMSSHITLTKWEVEYINQNNLIKSLELILLD